MYSFGFIGSGHMGSILAKAVAKSCNNIVVADATLENAIKLSNSINANVSNNIDIAKNSKYIVIGVKPQNLENLSKEIAPILNERTEKPVIISMCAGVKIGKIESLFSEDVPIIRIMPNTPAEVGMGMIVYSTNTIVNQVQKSEFLDAFKQAGEIEEINEDLIDAACSIHGCGPAFVYMFIIALAKAGENIGLDKGLALKLAKATVRGSGTLAIESDKTPDVLRDEVCSPGGSTIEGVKYLASTDFEEEISNTVRASFERTKELG